MGIVEDLGMNRSSTPSPTKQGGQGGIVEQMGMGRSSFPSPPAGLKSPEQGGGGWFDEYVAKPAKSFAANTASAAVGLVGLPLAAGADMILGNKDNGAQTFTGAPRLRDTVGHTLDQLRDYAAQQAPDASVGKVGRFARGVEEMVPNLLTGPVGLTNILQQAAFNEPADLVKSGVDSGTATKVGLTRLGAAAAMTRLPLAGKTKLGTVAKGGLTNVAAGQAENAVTNAELGDKYQEFQAPMFDPGQMGEQAAMGAGFGLHQRGANIARGIQKPGYFEGKAGQFLGEQMPKQGSALDHVMQRNLAEASDLSKETGAQFSLGQASNVNDVIAKERALSARSGEALNHDQQVQNENTAIVRQLIQEAGGDEGSLHDVLNGLTDALALHKDALSRAESEFSEAQGQKDVQRQQHVEHLQKRLNMLEEAKQRAEEILGEHAASREDLIGRVQRDVNDKGAQMLAESADKEETGRAARAKAAAIRKGAKEGADRRYDDVRVYSDVQVPDHSSLADAVRTVASEHPEDFRSLMDKADSVTRDILRRITPPEEGEQQYSPILDAQGNRVPIGGAEGQVEPLTIGELDALSKGVGKMRREAAAAGKYDLARRMGILKEGINSSLETVNEQGTKGLFNEQNTMDAGEWGDVAEGLRKNQFFVRAKKGGKFVTDSDFTKYMQQYYPSAVGTPKDVVLSAVDKAARGQFHRMTDSERSVIDNMNRDMTQQGATPKGQSLDKSPLEMISEANRYYREEYVPTWRDPDSPGAKILRDNTAGMERVKDAGVMAEFLKDNDKGSYTGRMYRQIFGKDLQPAKDYAQRDLLDAAFNGETNEWSAPTAEGWLKRKAYALRQIGIYDEMAETVGMVRDAAGLAKEPGLLKPVEEAKSDLEKAKKELSDFKARVGSPETAVPKVDMSNEQRVVEARQQALRSLEKSPVGKMVEGDFSTTMDRFVASAKGNYAEAVNLIMGTLEGNATAQAGFKRAFADYLYQQWLSQSSRTAEGDLKPMTGKAAKAADKFQPAIEALFSKAEQKKLEQARKIVEIMARGDQNVFKGSETVPHLNAALRAFTIVKYIPLMAQFKARLGSEATRIADRLYTGQLDKYLFKARFDPEYAQKLIQITKPKAPKEMARQLWHTFIQENMFVDKPAPAAPGNSDRRSRRDAAREM